MDDDQQIYMVFDVESDGLHGAGFAVGWQVISRIGAVHAEGCLVAPVPIREDWVRHNVLPNLPAVTHEGLASLRSDFWAAWTSWRDREAILAADVAWPVEARFLAACVNDEPGTRNWEGPYPLLDIASVRYAVGLNPLATETRLTDELPEHNPLNDARQSARLLVEALRDRRSADQPEAGGEG